MKRLRKIIFWCHLPVGVIAGLVILIMSVTGVLLAYERQITRWADTRGYHAAPPSPESERLLAETLLAKLFEAQPDTPTSFTLQADPDAPASANFTGGRVVFINAYTGEVLGEGSKKVRDFFRVVTDWHRWLGARSENRAVARAVTGACNLGFLFLVISGFYLWWPRKWTWSHLRNVIWFKRALSGKARDFNWHNVLGSWSVLPLFIIVLSGVVISYQWAGNLAYRIAGETPPPSRATSNQTPAQPSQRNEAHAQIKLDGFNQLWSRAQEQVSDWQSITLRMPASDDAPVAFTIDQGDGGQPQKRAQLTLDRNGQIKLWEPFSSYTAGRQARSFLRFAHTGEVAGIIGQTIAGIVSASAAVLVWTGLALSWRRFRAWLARRSGESLPRKEGTAIDVVIGDAAQDSQTVSSSGID